MRGDDLPTEDAGGTAEELSVGGQVLRAGIERRLFGADPEPARLGRFRLIEVLGRGGMGVVYEAYDPSLDRKVAVKVLAVGTHEARQRLLREAKALARLNHPNVVTIHEVGEDGDEVFVAMEYVDGGTLRSWCLEHPPGSVARTRAVLRFAHQAIEGLVAAHAIGVIHRDVKPANMLLGRDGRLRLADFGLARLGASLSGPARPAEHEGTAPIDATMTDAFAGTPAYMAPEQFEGRADERSDQFGFCMSFFEALYGVRAYEGTSIAALLESIDKGRVATPPDVSVPAHVRRVLVRGLSPDPAERFESMGELGVALRSGARRRRVFLGLGGGMLAAAAITGAVLGTRPAPCSDQSARIDAVVDSATRKDLYDAIRASGRPYPEELEQRADLELDNLARRWKAQRLDACRASRDPDPEVAAAGVSRRACLEGALQTTQQTMTELKSLTLAQANALPTTLEALLDLADCADADRETYDDEQGRALVAKLRDGYVADASFERDTARQAFEEVLSGSEPGQFSRLRAEAHIKLTEILVEDGDHEGFREHTIAALDEAELAGDPELIALAWMFMADLLPEATPWSTVQLFVGRVRRLERSDALSQRTRAMLAYHEAQLLFTHGRHEDAGRRIREAIELATPIGHVTLPYMHIVLADVLLTEGKAEEALQATGAAVDLLAEHVGAHHPDVATFLYRHAYTQSWASRDDEAIETLDRAIEVLAATPEYQPDNLLRAYESRADALRNTGRYDEALRGYAEALEFHDKHVGGRAWRPAVIQVEVARTYSMMAQPSRALETLEQALPQLRAGTTRHERQILLEASLLHAMVLAGLDRDKESSAQLEGVRPMVDEVYAQGSIAHMQAIQQIADILGEIGYTGEAQRELAIYLDAGAPADPVWTGLLQAARARVHLAAGERDDARAWALRALETLRPADAGPHEIAEVEALLEEIDGDEAPSAENVSGN